MSTEIIWLWVALIIFGIVCYKTMSKTVSKQIKGKIQEIENEILESVRLRANAYDRVTTLKEQYASVTADNKALIAAAQIEADRIVREAAHEANKISEKIPSLMALYNEKHENALLERLKTDIMLVVLTIVEDILIKRLSTKDKQQIVDDGKELFKKIWN